MNLMAVHERVLRQVGVSVVAIVLLSGCGYTLGYRVPEGVQTIAVPIFDNQTFPLRREIEYQLTQAFRREIQVRTELVLTDESSADLVVFGKIRRFHEHSVGENRFDRKIESNIDVIVDLIVEDHRNGKRWEHRVVRVEPLSIDRGETFDTAAARAIANLAERLVTRIEHWEIEGGDGEEGGDDDSQGLDDEALNSTGEEGDSASAPRCRVHLESSIA